MTNKTKRIIAFVVFIMIYAGLLIALPNNLVNFLLGLIAGWQIGTWASYFTRLYFPDEENT
jgi:ABC-type lipoprotein release transport system permease subunit